MYLHHVSAVLAKVEIYLKWVKKIVPSSLSFLKAQFLSLPVALFLSVNPCIFLIFFSLLSL